MFANHSHDYLHVTSVPGQWEACIYTPTQSVLPHHLITDPHGKDSLSVPVTESMVGVLHITEASSIHSSIDTLPKEKALYSATEDS